MSNTIKPIFSTLNDGAGSGEDLRSMQEGQAALGENGSLAFSYKDASNQAVLPALDGDGLMPVLVFDDANGDPVRPQLDSEGRLPVTMDAAGVHKRARAVATPVDNALNTVTTLALSTSKTYLDIKFSVSCRKACYFQLVKIDDVTETILDDVILDAGQYSFNNLMDYEIQSGATGTQSLVIKYQALNNNQFADVHGSIRCKESAIA